MDKFYAGFEGCIFLKFSLFIIDRVILGKELIAVLPSLVSKLKWIKMLELDRKVFSLVFFIGVVLAYFQSHVLT